MVGRRVARSEAAVAVVGPLGLGVVEGRVSLGLTGVDELGSRDPFVTAAVVAVVDDNGVMAMTPGSSRRSSWKCTRAATSSLENSRAVWVPAWMGAVKRGQRAAQAWR